jgi:hypothetical protein
LILPESVKYGEVDRDFVLRRHPELLRQAEQTFEFCLKRYGTGGRKIELRWIRPDAATYHFAKAREILEEIITGNPADLAAAGYLESEEIYGGVRTRLTRPDEPGPIFISVDVPLDKIQGTTGHEFYHARFSPGCMTAQQTAADEKAADEFGKRVVREMASEARRESDERWRRRFREYSSRR